MIIAPAVHSPLMRAKTGKQILPVANCFYHPFRVRFGETWALLHRAATENLARGMFWVKCRGLLKYFVFQRRESLLCVDIKATTEPRRRWGNWCDEAARHTRHNRQWERITSHISILTSPGRLSALREGWLDGDVLRILPSNGTRDFSIFMQIVSTISFTDSDLNMF